MSEGKIQRVWLNLLDGKDDKAPQLRKTMKTSASAGKPHVYDLIGRKLRDYYDDVAQQPVPDRFVELLQRLDSKMSDKKDS